MDTDRLDAALQTFVAKDGDLAGAVVALSRAADSANGSPGWLRGVGNLEGDSPFFVASVTKLYTTAIIMRLCDRQQLSLDDRLTDLLPAIGRIHQPRKRRSGSGVQADTTSLITVKHLLSQTSGLPDYFSGKPDGGFWNRGKSIEYLIRNGGDRAWTSAEAVAMAAERSAPFTPGEGRRALYSDTNFQLLGQIIEALTGDSYVDALQAEVLDPLDLTDTWLFVDPVDSRPVPLRDGSSELAIPLAMTSVAPDGGVVATAPDLLVFLRAFFEGELFATRHLAMMQADFRRIMFPLAYGTGIMRFRLPRMMAPPGQSTELVGHSGLSGAFAFLAPSEQIYLAGTVNNIAKPSRSFKLMLQLLRAA